MSVSKEQLTQIIEEMLAFYDGKKFVKDTKDEKAYLSKVNMMCKIHPEKYEEKPKKEEKK